MNTPILRPAVIGLAWTASVVLTDVPVLARGIVVLEFSPATLPGGSRGERFWEEDAFALLGEPDFSSVSATSTSPSRPSNGTDFVRFAYFDENVFITALDGRPFDLEAVDLAEYSTVIVKFGNQTPVDFLGRKPGEEVFRSITLDLVIDGPGHAADFERFEFDDEFHGLTSLVITSTVYAMDNLTVRTSDVPADVDGDGNVDFADVLAVIGAWGACDSCPEDIDSSGMVNLDDLLAVLVAWGDCS